MIETEESIRESYNALDWYKVSKDTRRLLLLAIIQQPQKTRFGGVFDKDRASLARYASPVRTAYEFGLLLLKVTKKHLISVLSHKFKLHLYHLTDTNPETDNY